MYKYTTESNLKALTDLHFNRRQVAVEAFSTADMSISGLLKRVLPNIASSFSNVASFFSGTDEAIQVPKQYRDFVNGIRKHSYMDLRPLSVYTPEGMTSTYLDYINTLRFAITYTEKAQERLNTLSTYISILLTNKGSEMETGNNIKNYKSMENERNAINEKIGAHFKVGSTVAEVSYETVVGRNADWEVVLPSIDDLSCSMNKIKFGEIKKKIAEVTDLLERVIKLLEKGGLENSAPEVAAELAEGSFQVAKEMEFLAITYYRVKALSQCINLTTASLTKTLEL